LGWLFHGILHTCLYNYLMKKLTFPCFRRFYRISPGGHKLGWAEPPRWSKICSGGFPPVVTNSCCWVSPGGHKFCGRICGEPHYLKTYVWSVFPLRKYKFLRWDQLKSAQCGMHKRDSRTEVCFKCAAVRAAHVGGEHCASVEKNSLPWNALVAELGSASNRSAECRTEVHETNTTRITTTPII
jgi:hypothetical protein